MSSRLSLYDSMGVGNVIRDFERSLCRVMEIEGGDFRYGGFQFSFVTSRNRQGGMELRTDVGSMVNPDETELLRKYTEWFKDWDIFSERTNGSGVVIPLARISSLEFLKEYISYSRTEDGPAGLVKIFYDLKSPFLFKGARENERAKKMAFRTLVVLPLKSWIDKNFSERVEEELDERKRDKRDG